MQKKNRKEFRVEKTIKRKGNKLYYVFKAMTILLTVGLINRTWYTWVNLFLNQNL